MLEVMASTGQSLAALAAGAPQGFYRLNEKIPVPDLAKAGVVAQAVTACRHAWAGQSPSIVDIDGTRFNFPDGSWVLIRESGTESFIRIMGEGTSQEQAERLEGESVGFVDAALRAIESVNK